MIVDVCASLAFICDFIAGRSFRSWTGSSTADGRQLGNHLRLWIYCSSDPSVTGKCSRYSESSMPPDHTAEHEGRARSDGWGSQALQCHQLAPAAPSEIQVLLHLWRWFCAHCRPDGRTVWCCILPSRIQQACVRGSDLHALGWVSSWPCVNSVSKPSSSPPSVWISSSPLPPFA